MRLEGDADSGYDLSGNLTYETVPKLFGQITLDFSKSTSLSLRNVERIDSAGLALLIEWSCLARKQNKQLVLKDLPASLRSMIDVGGLEEVLSVSAR
ncbi:MAG: STAS domain-containing protein [Arenicellales bacterium]|nr:STAS domain-containing protein [Arenicellales bacterium]